MRDNEALKSSSFAASLCAGGPIPTETSMFHKLMNCTLWTYFHSWESLSSELTFVLVDAILGKPCLHHAAEQKEEQTSCLGKTLQPEKPNVSVLYDVLEFILGQKQLCDVCRRDIFIMSAWQLKDGIWQLST